MHKLSIWDDDDPGRDPLCKGLFYRCRVSLFRRPSTGAYVQTVEFVPLKRKSCGGCERCGWLHEYIQESNGEFTADGWEDGEIYQLQVTDTSPNWESGIEECEAVGFVHVPKEMEALDGGKTL